MGIINQLITSGPYGMNVPSFNSTAARFPSQRLPATQNSSSARHPRPRRVTSTTGGDGGTGKIGKKSALWYSTTISPNHYYILDPCGCILKNTKKKTTINRNTDSGGLENQLGMHLSGGLDLFWGEIEPPNLGEKVMWDVLDGIFMGLSTSYTFGSDSYIAIEAMAKREKGECSHEWHGEFEYLCIVQQAIAIVFCCITSH